MNNQNNTKTASSGIGFCGLLAIAFIVLRLTGIIEWSWVWVLAPIWIPFVSVFAIILIVWAVFAIRRRRLFKKLSRR